MDFPQVNRRERRAYARHNYKAAQWYMLESLHRLSTRNWNALQDSIARGNRDPLRVQYRGLP